MVNLHDVDENAPWRNDPLAKRAVMAAREWNIHNRKGREETKPQQMAVIDYGIILLEVRGKNSSNKKYNEEVLARRLDIPPFDDRRQRTAALTLAKAIDVSVASKLRDVNAIDVPDVNRLFDNCDAVTALHMAAWARKTGLVPPKKQNRGAHAQARNHVRAAVENGDQINREQVAYELDVSPGTVQRAAMAEQGRLEGIVEGEAIALNEQGKFTKAQAKHVEALIKKYRRDLDAQFKAAVETQVNKQVKERKASLERAQEACVKQKNDAFRDQQHWKKLIDNHKFVFTKTEYIDILFCARNDHVPQERHHRATLALEAKKLQLTGEK